MHGGRARKASFAVALASLVLSASSTRAEPPPPPQSLPPLTSDANAFAPASTPCASSLEPIAQDACFLGPNEDVRDAGGAPLVVYLHGMYDAKGVGEELSRQSRLAKKAAARGMATLALKGKVGICDTRGDHTAFVCWPASEKVAYRAPDVVASWAPSLAKARARAGQGQTFVIGFSNGAYFAALLAIRDLFPADAFVIAQGGAAPPVHALGPKRPLLLLQTDARAPVVQGEMERLASALASDGWSFVQEERPGWHELTDADIDAALDFLVLSHGAAHQEKALNRTP